MYGITYSKKATKDLQKIAPKFRAVILAKLERLAADPDRAQNVKALQGAPLYRLRVGDYRVIYSRDDAIRVITVERVGDRREIYR